MEATEDGFKIAEKDLELRGGGEVLGARQSGMPEFRVAAVPDFEELLAAARDDARLVLEPGPAPHLAPRRGAPAAALPLRMRRSRPPVPGGLTNVIPAQAQSCPGNPLPACRLRVTAPLFASREMRCRHGRSTLASPCDRHRLRHDEGEDGASAVWTGHRRPLHALDCRAKSLDAPGGGDQPRARTPSPRNAIGLSSPVDSRVERLHG